MIQRRSLLIAGLAAVAPLAHATEDAVPLPPALDRLSDLPLLTMSGAATTLGQHVRPGPTLISFWASWCAPCVAEARYLSDVRRRHGADRLNIIGLNVELIANEEGVQRFLRETHANYTHLRADVAVYQAFGGPEQLNLPRLYVFDAQGRPSAAFGGVTVQDINHAVTGILGR
jgi:thiol-disulfide isomerase/thioredoxin